MKARYGYTGNMLFVDLSAGKVRTEELSEEMARRFIGGYGIGVRVLMERMKPGADPLGPDNILGIGTGPFTGSGALSTCRFTTMGKSPLTGYWGDANSGGDFGNVLKASGYDVVFFEGKAEHPVYVSIRDGKAEIKDARPLWGRDVRQTEEMIRSDNGDPTLKIASIGPAGEKCSRIAAIMNDQGRAAARSGLGAVMGSKNVKALVCEGSLKHEVFDKEKVASLMKAIVTEVKANPSPMYQVLSNFGTPGAMVPHLAIHAVPIRNWGGNNVEDFPEARWARVGWDGLAKYVTKKYACTGCPIACGGILNVPEGPYSAKNVHKPEYETLAMLGPNCLNDDMESLIYANELCNSYGLDTISTGGVIAFAIECYQNGILTISDTDGLALTWGNSTAIIELCKKIGEREGIGDLLAEGVAIAAERIGRGAERFATHVGGELLPAHDPREAPGWGATYVSEPVPARHTRGGTQFAEDGMANPATMAALGLPSVLEKYNTKGKGKAHALLAGWQHLINTAGLCLFAADAMPYPLLEVMNAVTGWNLTNEEMIRTGLRIATLLHAFNVREGFKPSDFIMPPRVEGKPPFKVGAFKDLTLDMEDLKRQFYEAMGFDYTTGAIQKEKIVELGLQDVCIGEDR